MGRIVQSKATPRPPVGSVPSNFVSCPCCGAEQADVDFLADPGSYTISTRHGMIRISPKEFAFAVFLLERAPTLVSKTAIYEKIFMNADGGGPDFKIVDVVGCRVRAALPMIGFELVTEWGSGMRVSPLGPEGVVDARLVMRKPRGPQQRWTLPWIPKSQIFSNGATRPRRSLP